MFDFDIIDAHHHLWDLSNEYPWLTAEAGDPKRFYGNDATMRSQNYLVDDLLADVASAGLRLGGSVHVEAAPKDPLAEAAWLDNVRGSSGFPTVGVGAIDLASKDVEQQLARLSGYRWMRGVREIVAWHENPHATFAATPGVMDDPAWRSGFALLERYGLSFDLQIYPSQIRAAIELARQFPNIQIALVHTASPHFTAPGDSRMWADGLKGMAALPNTVLKISGLSMFFHQLSQETAGDIVSRAIDAYGPSRVIFGSNFPVDGINTTYADTYDFFDRATGGYSRSERMQMFSDNANRFYRIND